MRCIKITQGASYNSHMGLPTRKHYEEFVGENEFNQMSQNLQNYVRAVFGLVKISEKSEQELWEKLTAEEREKVSEITKRMMGTIR